MADPDDLAWLQETRLELLADDAGLGPEELRGWLRGEIDRARKYPQRMTTTNTMPSPIAADATEETIICQQCVSEKNNPGASGRGWGFDEVGFEDVEFIAELPLSEDFAIVTCPHGHQHGVVRAGSERAADFGVV